MTKGKERKKTHNHLKINLEMCFHWKNLEKKQEKY